MAQSSSGSRKLPFNRNECDVKRFIRTWIFASLFRDLTPYGHICEVRLSSPPLVFRCAVCFHVNVRISSSARMHPARCRVHKFCANCGSGAGREYTCSMETSCRSSFVQFCNQRTTLPRGTKPHLKHLLEARILHVPLVVKALFACCGLFPRASATHPTSLVNPDRRLPRSPHTLHASGLSQRAQCGTRTAAGYSINHRFTRCRASRPERLLYNLT